MDEVEIIKQKVERAKKILMRKAADAAIVLRSFDIVYDPEYAEMAYTTKVDGRRMIVLGKMFLKEKDNMLLAGVILHEIGHNVSKHVERMIDLMEKEKDEYSQEALNIAADAVINRWEIQQGFPLVDWDKELKKYGVTVEGKTMEEIYRELKQKMKTGQGGNGEGKGGKEGKGKGKGKGEGKGNKKSGENRDLIKGAKEVIRHRKKGNGKKKWKQIQKGLNGDFSKYEKKLMKKITSSCKGARTSSGSKAGKAGTGSNDGITEEKAGKEYSVWRKLLRYVVDQYVDRSFLRPSRRHPDLMGRVKRSSKKSIVVAVDTSGSVQGDVLKSFVGTINKIVQKIRADVMVISWSSGYAIKQYKGKVDKIPNIDGGTDFISVQEAVEKEKIQGRVLIVFTDGEIMEEGEKAKEIVNRLKKHFNKVILVTTSQVIPGRWDKVFEVKS